MRPILQIILTCALAIAIAPTGTAAVNPKAKNKAMQYRACLQKHAEEEKQKATPSIALVEAACQNDLAALLAIIPAQQAAHLQANARRAIELEFTK